MSCSPMPPSPVLSRWPDSAANGTVAVRWLIGFAVLLVLAALTRQNGLVLLPTGAAALGVIIARRQTIRRSLLYAAGMLGLMLALMGGASLALALARRP